MMSFGVGYPFHRTGRARRPMCWLTACIVVANLTTGSAGATSYADLVGTVAVHQAVAGETLVEIARRYDLGFVELVAANPDVDPWLPDGQRIVLPTAHILPDGPRDGILINLADQRLYYFPPWPGPVQTHPISIGTDHNQTPVGTTSVIGKRENPTWIPPESVRAERPNLPSVIPPGPTNPLGAFSLDLGLPGYRIHGTPSPYSIGRRATHGCVRLYPEDVAALFPQIPPGLTVTMTDQPVKLGWFGGELFLEVHPSQAQADELELRQPVTPAPIADLTARVEDAAGAHVNRIDWDSVARAGRQRSGTPVRITR